MGECGREYRQRRRESTALYRAVQEGWHHALAEANERAGLPKRLSEEAAVFASNEDAHA
jgi:hypothetical protein